MLLNKIKSFKLKLSQYNFQNKKNNFNFKEIIFMIILIIFSISIIVIKFFYYNDRWLTIDEITTSIYLNNLYQNITYILVGFCIPIVGASMQIVTQNKLAEPTTLGFYPVIYMGILLSQLTINSSATSYIFAILLSTFVILINFLIVKGNPTNNTFKSVLIGFSINAITTGINYLIINYSNANGDPLLWLSGNIGTITLNRLIISSTISIFFTLIILFASPYLNIINKNYILAKVLGIKINLIYWIIAICSLMVSISSILLLGGIILLGIVVPHIIRILIKPSNVFMLFILSGIFGSSMLVCSAWLVETISYNFNLVFNINFLPSIFSIFIFINLFKNKKE